MPDSSKRSVTLLGSSFVEPGKIELRSVGEGSACAISVGSTAAIARKKKEAAPNEDALYLDDDGSYAIHLVADGHYGVESSEALVHSLGELFDVDGPTADAYQLYGMMAQAWRKREPLGKSRSTFVVAAVRRPSGTVRGFSVGDSACFLVKPDGTVHRLDNPSRHYLAPWDYYSLGVPSTSHFEAEVAPGDAVICCTDGVTECHYGNPERSVLPVDVAEIALRHRGDARAIAEALGLLALTGVRNEPGGEDNFSISVSVV